MSLPPTANSTPFCKHSLKGLIASIARKLLYCCQRLSSRKLCDQ